jgi:hypothetical protein
MKTGYETLVSLIIAEQEKVVGQLAWTEAKKVEGLTITGTTVTLLADGKLVTEGLVRQYQQLFGQASVEVCRTVYQRSKLEFKDGDVPEIIR